MSETIRCRVCGQPLPPRQREGVWLPALKADIFDVVDRHGGITAEGIAFHCFGDEARIPLVRVHISQINELLAATSTRISGNIRGCRGEYRVIRGRYQSAT
jgi:hypothetical protein